MLNIRTFYLFLLPFFPGMLSAQPYDRPAYEGFQSGHAMYHWTTSNGLPQSHVSGIAQSKNGLIWISTYNGVVNFDGRKFSRIEPEKSPGAISPFVTAISTFGDTIVWASPQEIVFYSGNRILSVIPVKDANVFITSISFYRGKFYFRAHDRLYFLQDKNLHPLISTSAEKPLNNSTILTGIFHNNRFIALVRHNLSGQTLFYTYDYANKSRTVVRTKSSFENLKLYNGQLIAFSDGHWMKLSESMHPGKIIQESPVNRTEGRLQTGMEGNCFFHYTKTQLALQHGNSKPAILNTEKTMYGTEIFASFEDRDGNLWIGTNSLGLFMFRKYPFTLFNFSEDQPVSNSSHAFVDNDGLLWFDNDCQATIGFDLKNGQIRHVIPNICNWTNIHWSTDSLALFAYGNSGHYWFSKKSNRLTGIEQFTTPITNFLQLSPKHYILAGEGALYHWNGRKLLPWKKFSRPKTTCNQLLQLGEHEFYFATTEGLYYSKDNNFILAVGKPEIKNPDFRSLRLIAGTPYLLIGTDQSGILRYNIQTGDLRRLPNIPTQLLSCWTIIEDRFGQLWITSNNGIVQVFLKDLMECFDGKRTFFALNHYRHENGIDNVEFNSRTGNKGVLLTDGSIVFSSLGGPVIVHPQANDPADELGELLVEEIIVNTKHLRSFGKLLLTEGDLVQLTFTVPSFSSERVLGFEYRVKGMRTDWTPTFNYQITLDNLPAGNHVLEIRTNSGERTLRIPVTVKKLHPNRWLWITLGIFVTALLIVFITRYFTKRAQQKKLALKDLKLQLKLLEMEALRSQMNPHFIFNCLNTIQFLFISGHVDRANNYLTNFSGLMRMTLDLLRQPITTLDLELKMTTIYIELEQLQFDDGFEFRLINNLETPTSRIKVPSLFFQVFIENAIIHGLRRTDEPRPVLSLILEETFESYVFRVGDNGPGVDRQEKEDHTSIGIGLLAERFALKKEIYNWPMEFHLKEHETIENDIKTEIIITFGKVHLENHNT